MAYMLVAKHGFVDCAAQSKDSCFTRRLLTDCTIHGLNNWHCGGCTNLQISAISSCVKLYSGLKNRSYIPLLESRSYTVGSHLSEHAGTGWCSDNRNVWIIELVIK